MTPFAEDLLEISPRMEEFYKDAVFFDLTHRTDSLEERMHAFMNGNAFSYEIRPEPGKYWFECSGLSDRRIRVGFAAEVEGNEITAEVVMRGPDGTWSSPEGICWAVFSKYRMLGSTVPTKDGCTLHPAFPILLLACVEATR